MATVNGRRRARARTAGVVAAALAGVLALVVIAAPLIIQGARLGRVVEWLMPAMRGHVHVGGGHWSWGAVLQIARGRPGALQVEDVRVTDPEGTEVLRIARASASVQLRKESPRLVVRDLHVEQARWVFADMRGGGGVGFLAALSPAGPSRPARGGGPSGISIADARLDGIDAAFDMAEWGLALRNTFAVASLGVQPDGTGRDLLTFEVHGADARGGGALRLGPRAAKWQLPFSQARLDRVATTADDPDAIQLRASGVKTGRSTLQVTGVFPGVYGVSRPRVAPGIDLEAQLDDAADAATALLSSRGLARGLEIGGDGARLGVVFKGPFARLGIHVEAAGFQLRYGGLDLRGVGFRVSAAPWAARYALRGLSADSRAGGRVSGDVDVERTRIELGLDFDRFATGPLLPAALRVPALGALDGTVRVSFDPAAGVGSVERVALTLRRPPGAAGPRVVRLRAAAGDLARGTLRVPRVALSLAGASLTAGGSVALWDPARHDWLSPPTLDLTVAAQGLALDQLLGVGFVRGRLSFRARLRGPLDDLGVAIEVPPAQSLLILDQSFRLPRRLALRLDDRGLVMSEAVLEGPEESEIGAAGHLAMSGRFDVAVTARRFPFGRLPGLGQTALPFAGEISGELRLAGDAERPRLSGQLSFDPVTFQGRRVGGGLVTVDPVPGGGIHARGRLAQGIDAEGTLRPGRGGLEGEATMELHALRLDPFLAALPGGVRAVGVVSGAVVARVAPGHPASVDGKLTELALSVEPPAWATRARAVELHAERTIEISAESGQGAIHIGPAHFGGSFGSFEVEGEAQGGRARAALRGHVELGAFAPLTAAWLDRLTGAVDVDVTAARAAESAPLALEGGVTVTRPLAVRARALPIEIGIPSGRLRLSETGVDTTGLPVTLPGGTVHVSGGVTQPAGGGPARLALSATGNLDAQLAALLAPKLVRRAQGKVSLTALLDGTPQRPLLRAGVDLGRTALELPGVGNVTVGSAGLRLAGDPERTMMLSGDVEVAEARIPASALKEAKAKAKRPAARPARPPSAADRLRLDVRLRSRDGAVHIEVPKAPDLTLDLDMRVGGSLAQPQITGKTEGSDLYSRFVLWLTGAPH